MSSGCNCHGSDGQSSARVMGVLERPRYSPGLILEDSDLTAAVDYTRELNRLLFRSLFGCGVICGLDVAVKEDCDLVVTVNPGLGLDGCGDPIHLTGQARVRLGKRDGVLAEDEATPSRTDFWVIACNREKHCAPRTLVCDGDDLDCSSQPTRIRAGVEIAVSFDPPTCGCRCGTYDPNPTTLDGIAQELRDEQRSDWETLRDGYVARCHGDHYDNPDCAPDCGCGTACSCSCCILLGWAHWSRDEIDPGWRVYHFGVRRFVRPALIPDPRRDFAAAAAGTAAVPAAMSVRLQELAIEEMERVRKAGIGGAAPVDTATLAKGTVDALAMALHRMVPQLAQGTKAQTADPAAAKPAAGQAGERPADGSKGN